MIKLRKYIFIVSLIIGLIIWNCQNAYSQNRIVDSIIALIKKDKRDTNKVKHLNDLGWELMYNNPDTAIILSRQAEKLAGLIHIDKKKGWLRGIAQSNNNLGTYYLIKGNYPKALEHYFIALKLNKVTGNKSEVGANFGNIGGVYYYMGDYSHALENYFRSLKLNEETGDKKGMASDFNNIGLVNKDQGEFTKALEYYFKSLKLNEETGDKNGVGINLGNIGIVFALQGDYANALENFLKALKLNEVVGDKDGVGLNLGNIGNIYKEQGNYSMALEYYFKAFKLNHEIGNKYGEATNLGNIGDLFIKQKKYREAEEYLLKAVEISTEIGVLELIQNHNMFFSDLYSQTNRYQLAYEHYKQYTLAKDSLFNEEKNKALTRKEMNYEFEKKESATKAKQDKKDAIAKEELKRKEQQRNYFIVGFAIVLILAIFILRGFRQKQKANILILQQKLEVEMKNEIIEEKQKEILDSIRYAKRIQMALLPSKKYIQKSFDSLKK